MPVDKSGDLTRALPLTRRATLGGSLAGAMSGLYTDPARASAVKDRLSVADFGARGDGSDATAAIQAALDAAAPRRASVFVPAGLYPLSRSLRMPNFVDLVGEGRGSILDNQNSRLEAPQLINADAQALLYVSLRNMIFRGGTHAIKLDVREEVAGLHIDTCSFELQTKGCVEVNKLLQVSLFQNCSFDRAPFGLFVAGFTSNMNTFLGCHFTNISGPSVYMRSAEVNTFLGCRFEGDGRERLATIDLEDARNITFQGCYFEATHEFVLREKRSANGVTFAQSHFTGSRSQTGLGPYRFESDGIVSFHANSFFRDTVLPRRAMVTGPGAPTTRGTIIYLEHGRDRRHVRAPARPAPRNPEPLLRVRRIGAPAAGLALAAQLRGRTFAPGNTRAQYWEIEARTTPSGAVELRLHPDNQAVLDTRQVGEGDWIIDWIGGASEAQVQWELEADGIPADESYIEIDFS